MLMKAALHIMRQFVQSHHQSGRVSKVIVLLALILLGLPLAALAQGPDWVDFQAASGVLGQPDFTSFAPNFPTISASTMSYPYKAVVDPTTGKLFVADTNNGRILRFTAAAALTNGAVAEGVLGQGNFTSPNITGCNATQMNTISSIAVDTMGRLWVVDYGNHRVLRFDNASSKANGDPADGVLGQSSLASCGGPATTQDRMNSPNDVAVDSAGRLWVSEAGNHRVLRFDNAASKPDGANADGVLGQPNFGSGGATLSPTGMNEPAGVIADSAGHLWVADANNRRVLRFDNAASKPNGASADGVLGQIDLSSNSNATTDKGMNLPYGVAVDSVGRLYVSEKGYDPTFNHRVLIFDKAATLSNGAAANHVLGQPDFISHTPNNGGVSAKSLYGPYFISFDTINNMLWVADWWNNHRVLRYQAPPVPKIAAAVGGVAQQFEVAPAATSQWGVMALSGLLLLGAGLVAWRRG